MGAEVYFWWMIVFAGNGSAGATVIPVPYQTREMCEWAAKESWAQAKCIPQPAADVAEFSATKAVGREPEVCEIPAD